MTQKLSADIDKILLTSRHAPSSHNTQPWQVSVTGHSLILGYARERHLRVGDPDKRELFISLGCFIESFIGAAQALGYAVQVTFIGEEAARVARLQLEAHGEGHPALDGLIRQRRSDRRLYTPKRLEQTVIDELQQLRQGQARFKLFTEKPVIDFLALQTFEATYAAMSDPAFRAELAGWIRNNWTKQPDGMPAYTQGIPGPVSLIAKFIIKKNKAVAKDQAKKDSQRVTHSAAVGLIYNPQQTAAGWLDAGRLYQRACLIAQKHEVRTAGVSAAVIHHQTSHQIRQQLSLAAPPIALLRFGYTKNHPKASPRLPVHRFLLSDF